MPADHPRRKGGSHDKVIRYTKRLNSDYAEKGDVQGARRLVEEMLSEGVAPSLVTANTLVKAYRATRYILVHLVCARCAQSGGAHRGTWWAATLAASPGDPSSTHT